MSHETEFGDDRGTLWPTTGEGVQIWYPSGSARSHRRQLRKLASRRPIVWLVDDEQASRRWFVDNHRHHYALVTFTSHTHVVEALQADVPCDIVVTDVFFAATTPKTQEEESALLSIYDKIEQTTIAQLPPLWADLRKYWQLHGFTVARTLWNGPAVAIEGFQ